MPSVTFLPSLLNCLTPRLSLFCVCLSQSGWVFWNLTVSPCPSFHLCFPDVFSPSVAPCPSVCPRDGAGSVLTTVDCASWSGGQLGPSGCVIPHRLSICPSFLETCAMALQLCLLGSTQDDRGLQPGSPQCCPPPGPSRHKLAVGGVCGECA